MKITKEQAIINHRKMWRWIADETENTGIIHDEIDYLIRFAKGIPYRNSFCCQYANEQFITLSNSRCFYCSLDWGSDRTTMQCMDVYNYNDNKNIYGLWVESKYKQDIQGCVELARQIAELPERPLYSLS